MFSLLIQLYSLTVCCRLRGRNANNNASEDVFAMSMLNGYVFSEQEEWFGYPAGMALLFVSEDSASIYLKSSAVELLIHGKRFPPSHRSSNNGSPSSVFIEDHLTKAAADLGLKYLNFLGARLLSETCI